MDTPTFTFRLPTETRLRLDDLAKLMGKDSTGDFLREICAAVTAPDSGPMTRLVRRIRHKTGEQLTLTLHGAPTGHRRGRRHARAT